MICDTGCCVCALGGRVTTRSLAKGGSEFGGAVAATVGPLSSENVEGGISVG